MLNKLKNIKITKNEIIMIVLIFIIIIIGLYNGTFAFFSTQKDTKISVSSKDTFENTKVIKSNVILEGELSHTTNKTQGLNTSNTISIQLEDVTDYDYLVTLATQIDPHNTNFLEEVGSSIKYEVYHKTDTSVDTSTLSCESKKYISGEIEDYCQTGTFENKLDGTPFDIITDYRISDTNTHYFDVYIYLSNESIGTSKLKTSFFFLTTPINKPVPQYIESPDLTTGLIPVVYDGDNKTENGTGWFVADTTKAWYDYEEQWWANAVSVDSSTAEKREKYVNTDGTYKTGTEIATADMLAMFVWIPRYSYTIGCADVNENGNGEDDGCYGYRMNDNPDTDPGVPSQQLPGAIDIKFVAKNVTEDDFNTKDIYPTYTYNVDSNGMPTTDRNPKNWYTPPAFWWDKNNNGKRWETDENGGIVYEIEEELSGIWVGKFETSVNTTSVCYTSMSSDNCNNSYQNPRILPNVKSLGYQTVQNQFLTAQKFNASGNVYGIESTKLDAHMMKNSEWASVVYLSQSIYGKYGNKDYSGANKEIYKNDSSSYYTGRSQGGVPATSSSSDDGTYKYDGTNTSTSGTICLLCGTGASTTGNIYGIYDMSGGSHDRLMGNYNNSEAASGFTFTTDKIKYYDKFTTTTPYSTKSKETVGQALYEVAGWYSDNKADLSDYSPWMNRGGKDTHSSNAGAFSSISTSLIIGDGTSFRSVLVMTGA